MSQLQLRADSIVCDPNYRVLKRHLISATGLACYESRDAELAGQIATRLSALNLDDCRAYLTRLTAGDGSQAELDTLIETLTIGETHFFRQPGLFQALQQAIVPRLLDRNRNVRTLRIWSAGSSFGAEAYSISILLQRHFAAELKDWDVSITATDINRAFLARGRAAQFQEWALRGVDAPLRRQCFVPRDGLWEVKSLYRQAVSFQYHNLVSGPLRTRAGQLLQFDLILCRNVLIYFSQTLVRQIIEQMRDNLVDGGWLLVGHAEHQPGWFSNFQTHVFNSVTTYRNTDRSERVAQGMSMPSPECAAPAATQVRLQNHGSRRPGGSIAAIAQTASRCQPPVVDSAMAAVQRLADSGRADEADAQCRDLMNRKKLDPAVHLLHARVLEQLGRMEPAERALRRALYLDRGSSVAHQRLGQFLLRQGRIREATRCLRNALQVVSNLPSDTVVDHSGGERAVNVHAAIERQLKELT